MNLQPPVVAAIITSAVSLAIKLIGDKPGASSSSVTVAPNIYVSSPSGGTGGANRGALSVLLAGAIVVVIMLHPSLFNTRAAVLTTARPGPTTSAPTPTPESSLEAQFASFLNNYLAAAKSRDPAVLSGYWAFPARWYCRKQPLRDGADLAKQMPAVGTRSAFGAPVVVSVVESAGVITARVRLPWRHANVKPQPIVEYRLTRASLGQPFRIISALDLPGCSRAPT